MCMLLLDKIENWWYNGMDDWNWGWIGDELKTGAENKK